MLQGTVNMRSEQQHHPVGFCEIALPLPGGNRMRHAGGWHGGKQPFSDFIHTRMHACALVARCPAEKDGIILVDEVVAGAYAAAAGVRPGDVLLATSARAQVCVWRAPWVWGSSGCIPASGKRMGGPVAAGLPPHRTTRECIDFLGRGTAACSWRAPWQLVGAKAAPASQVFGMAART